jgi:hypothetical protein
MDKVQETLERWCSAAGMNFGDDRAEESYKKRARRVADVVKLKIPANHVFQFVEEEYVNAEEFYDAFLDDPADFMMRVYLPRVCGALEPLKTLAPFSTWFGYYIGLVSNVTLFGIPGMSGALEALVKAGQEAIKWVTHVREETAQIASLGYPDILGGHSAAPFDIIGDWFRGTRGIMLDMFRYPDKLLAAMERLVPILIRMAADQSRRS